MIQLRDYQVDMVNRTRDALRRHQRVLLQSPTGSGKTAIACHMMGAAREKGLSSMFLVHQNELLKQTSAALWHNKIEHGLIAAGKAKSPHAVQLASVMTLKNRLAHYQEPSLIIIDESHRALAPSYLQIIEHYPSAKVVGLTATPQRTDGKGLGHLYQEIVKGPSIIYLTGQGYLCDYELFGVPQLVDVSGIKKKAGDYDAGELEKEFNKPKITGDAIQHWNQLAKGLTTVVMCVSIQHAEDVAEQFRQAGISSAAIHGKTKSREEVLDKFENGEITVLTSVQLLVEGYDHPEIAAVVWLRPTQSLSVYLQGIGRGLRPHPSKSHLVIIDHVGNYARHGLPCADREWSLEDRKTRGRGDDSDEPRLSVQVCDKCYFTIKSGSTECPKCGAEIELKTREIEQVEGELQRIKEAAEAEERKKAMRIEQGMAKTIKELVEIGVSRKMKNPTGWAANIFAARQGRRAGAKDYAEARQAYNEVVA